MRTVFALPALSTLRGMLQHVLGREVATAPGRGDAVVPVAPVAVAPLAVAPVLPRQWRSAAALELEDALEEATAALERRLAVARRRPLPPAEGVMIEWAVELLAAIRAGRDDEVWDEISFGPAG